MPPLHDGRAVGERLGHRPLVIPGVATLSRVRALRGGRRRRRRDLVRTPRARRAEGPALLTPRDPRRLLGGQHVALLLARRRHHLAARLAARARFAVLRRPSTRAPLARGRALDDVRRRAVARAARRRRRRPRPPHVPLVALEAAHPRTHRRRPQLTGRAAADAEAWCGAAGAAVDRAAARARAARERRRRLGALARLEARRRRRREGAALRAPLAAAHQRERDVAAEARRRAAFAHAHARSTAVVVGEDVTGGGGCRSAGADAAGQRLRVWRRRPGSLR